MRDDLKAHLDEHNVPWVETEDLDSVLPEVDVVYKRESRRSASRTRRHTRR